jgi:LPPG:FO 2-phospho-L-lactate transferase
MKIAALAGGAGGSKLVLGLYRVMEPQDLTVIANTGDDIVMHGLHVSPDPDILVYTLADVVNVATGWGIRDESFRVAEGLARYGRPIWFSSGTAISPHISIAPRCWRTARRCRRS